MKRWERKQIGFTIVELLIVVVVIAILAAITIVAYNGISQRAKVSALQSRLNQTAKKLESVKVVTSAYPADTTALVAQGIDVTNVAEYIVNNTTSPANYCLTISSDNVKYSVTSTSGAPLEGECVTNLSTEPAATQPLTEIDGAGWRTTRWFGQAPATGGYVPVTGAADGPSGSGLTTYIRKTWTAVHATTTGDFGFEHSFGASSAASTQGLVVQGGEVYTISSYLRPSVNYNTANLWIYWHDTTGAFLNTSGVSNVALTANQWKRLSTTVTAPATAKTVGMISDIDGQMPVVGMKLDGTGLMVTRGDTLYGYGDGNSPGWFWNGTPDNSTSTGPAVAQ